MLPQLFRFLLPMQNPLGFGAIDFIALGLAILLVAVILARTCILAFAHVLANRPLLSMPVLAAVPILLRLALLAHHPVPTPRVADDFSYLLLGDTLAHFRLANPEHPMHRFFEGVFVLQDPSWSSIFPLGQGLVLAFGQLIFHLPWAGVLLSEGALAALCYWMLRAWVAPAWALAGGLLAALEFGPLSPWMNTYWGGAVSGIAGCLVFGALPRLPGKKRKGRCPAPLYTAGNLPHDGADAARFARVSQKYAVVLGIGLSLELLTRPFEFVLLVLIVLLFFVPVRSLAIAALVLLPAIGLTLLQNKQVTGRWTTLPYQLSRYDYGVPATFTFQPNPIPHRPLTVEQQVDYDAQIAAHGKGTDTFGSWVARLSERVRFYRFFFFAPLYLALPAFLFALKEPRFIRVAIALLIFWLGDAFYPYFYPHYIAAAACLFVLVSVKGLEKLSRFRKFGNFGNEAVTLILTLCLAHFLFWYGIHLAGNESLLIATSSSESWDEINYGDPEGRIAINDELAKAPGKQLVFVHYSPQHGAHEWIHNAAAIDRSRVVWAIDLGPSEDDLLRRYYPDRHAWLLEADAHPPKLTEVPSPLPPQ